MTSRTRLLAWIYIVVCGGCIAVGVVLCLGLLLSPDPRSGRALGTIGGFFVSLSVVYFIPGFVGGLGLLRGRRWARVVIIVLSCLGIFAFPVGTALGGFGLWVLLGADSKRPPDSRIDERPKEAPGRTLTLSPADKARYAGLLLAAAGVGAGFVVMIGTGYRVTRTPSSPIGDVLYFAAIGVLVLVVGLVVRNKWPRKPPSHVPPPNVHTPPPVAPSWDEFKDLQSRIEPLARIIDAPPGLIPTFQRSLGNGLPHIVIDGDTYHYVLKERGEEFERYSTTSLDDLLYRIFRDVAFSMATNLDRANRKPGEDFRREQFKQQLALLARLKPEWVTRCAAEHEEPRR